MRSNSEVASRENAKFNRPKRKFRIIRIKVAKRVSNEEKKKPKMQSCDMCYIHHNVGSFGRHYFVFVYIIPLLIGLLQVDYQSKQKSPFETHAPNMWIFLAATCIYCLGLSTKMELQNHHRRNNTQIIIGYVNLSSGALSSIALASIFLPQWLGWLCLGSWTILPIMQARRFVNQKNYRWLKRSIEKTTSLARGRFNRFWGCLRFKKRNLPM